MRHHAHCTIIFKTKNPISKIRIVLELILICSQIRIIDLLLIIFKLLDNCLNLGLFPALNPGNTVCCGSQPLGIQLWDNCLNLGLFPALNPGNTVCCGSQPLGIQLLDNCLNLGLFPALNPGNTGCGPQPLRYDKYK